MAHLPDCNSSKQSGVEFPATAGRSTSISCQLFLMPLNLRCSPSRCDLVRRRDGIRSRMPPMAVYGLSCPFLNQSTNKFSLYYTVVFSRKPLDAFLFPVVQVLCCESLHTNRSASTQIRLLTSNSHNTPLSYQLFVLSCQYPAPPPLSLSALFCRAFHIVWQLRV